MSRYLSHLRQACALVAAYPQGEPLALYLKAFFSGHKKFGSTDRRRITSCCYSYFRCFSLFPSDTALEEQVLQSYYLCHGDSAFFQAVRPDWPDPSAVSAPEKCAWLGYDPARLFRYASSLSPHIDAAAFSLSLLRQPDTFLRLRPGFVFPDTSPEDVLGRETDRILRVRSGTDVRRWGRPDLDFVIQDRNSASVFDLMQRAGPPPRLSPLLRIWDACAASGGKTLLLHDTLAGPLEFTISDLRPAMLRQHALRMKAAGLPIRHSFAADLTVPLPAEAGSGYDLVVCDAPCTGSGTWSRTPEQHYSFEYTKLERHSCRQRDILASIIPRLRKGGWLSYVTCSVFRSENEDRVEELVRHGGMECLGMTYLQGYDRGADTMFTALLRKI